MKLIAVAITSWLLGAATLLLQLYEYEKAAGADGPGGASTSSLVAAVLGFALLSVPGFYWLRRRSGESRPARLFPLKLAMILNATVFLTAVLLAGRTLPFTETLLFTATFVVIGLAFGLGFVWSYRAEVPAASSEGGAGYSSLAGLTIIRHEPSN